MKVVETMLWNCNQGFLLAAPMLSVAPTISYEFVNETQEGQELDVSFKEVSFLRLLMMTSLLLVFLYICARWYPYVYVDLHVS